MRGECIHCLRIAPEGSNTLVRKWICFANVLQCCHGEDTFVLVFEKLLNCIGDLIWSHLEVVCLLVAKFVECVQILFQCRFQLLEELYQEQGLCEGILVPVGANVSLTCPLIKVVLTVLDATSTVSSASRLNVLRLIFYDVGIENRGRNGEGAVQA